MPAFKAPQYTKVTNPKTGAQEPCYIFNVDYTPEDQGMSFIADAPSDITLQALQKTVVENVAWWNTFIGQFLLASAKLFAKPYTVENINKICKHTLTGTTADKFPANVTFLPKSIQISGGIFTVNWNYTTEPMIIDIPDLEAPAGIELNSLPDSEKNRVLEGVEEVNLDDLPVDKNATEATLEIDSPAKFYDKQRVKEARLKAKLAVYKAQRTMAEYYQKYGDDISDSDTESEYTTSDQESEEEEEAVQL